VTTGSWNRDAFSYLPNGQWVGKKWNRTWSGTDYGSPPPYNEATDHVYDVVGLGAGHARAIMRSLAEDARKSDILAHELQKSGRKADYDRRKAEQQTKQLAQMKASYQFYLDRLKGRQGELARRKAEKDWRKLHGVPFPKALLNAPPPRDYIPKKSYVVKVPAKVNPKPPKRALVEDHPYSMNETLLMDEEIALRTSFNPFDPNRIVRRAVMGIHAEGTWAPANLLDANDQIKMVNKLREKLQGSDFNMSVFLAEGHRSLRLIGDTSIRIAKSLFHVKRGDFWGASRALFEGTSRAPLAPRHPSWGRLTDDAGELAARVLELQYGYKPLFKDVHAGAEQLAHYLNYPATKTYRVGVRKELNLSKSSQWTIEGYGPTPNITAKATSGSSRVHGRHLIARISEGGLPTLPAALGLLDPELIAWEVIPFSFIADWFIPIGPYLEARASASRLEGKFVTSDKMIGKSFVPQSSWYTTSPDPPFVGYTGVSFTRTISSVLAVPLPTVKSFKKAASFQHCLNGLALLVSYGSGKIRAL